LKAPSRRVGQPFDDDVREALGVLARRGEGRAVADGLRVEDDDIGKGAGSEPAAVLQLEMVGGQAGHLADHLRQRHGLAVERGAQQPGNVP